MPSFAYLLGFRGTNYIGRKSGMVSVIYEENYESARERSEGCLGGAGWSPSQGMNMFAFGPRKTVIDAY